MSDKAQKRIIETPNLNLIPCEMAHVEAIMRDGHELGRMLGISVPDNWPTFPDTMEHVRNHLRSDPSGIDWGFRLIVHAADRMLIGEGGYKGRPDAEGTVEIGYAIIPEYRRRGLASEAARGLADYAFSHPEVRTLQAHTLPDGTASIQVLKKLGMKFMGAVIDDPTDGEVYRWRVERADYIS